jgi:hypothetical protein
MTYSTRAVSVSTGRVQAKLIGFVSRAQFVTVIAVIYNHAFVLHKDVWPGPIGITG